MDIGLIASSTVSFLVPYLSRLVKKLAGKVGEDISEYTEEKIKTLYETIRNKFKKDDYASKTLDRLEKDPEDEVRQQTMVSIIKETLSEDETFRKELEQLLNDVKQAAGGNIIQTGNGVIASNHSVAAGNGGYAAGRDININK